MENKTKWYRDPDVITKIIAVAFLVLLGCCIHFFAQDFFDKTLKLALSGNVNALAVFWALGNCNQFFTGCVHQFGQYFSFNFSFDG